MAVEFSTELFLGDWVNRNILPVLRDMGGWSVFWNNDNMWRPIHLAGPFDKYEDALKIHNSLGLECLRTTRMPSPSVRGISEFISNLWHEWPMTGKDFDFSELIWKLYTYADGFHDSYSNQSTFRYGLNEAITYAKMNFPDSPDAVFYISRLNYILGWLDGQLPPENS